MDSSNKTNKDVSCATEDRRRRSRCDLILIGAILLIALAAALVTFLMKSEGDTVSVTVDGKLYGEFPLSVNTEVTVESPLGYNILIIEDGVAYIREASCPDGICSSHRPVKNDGESIICLPNKMVLEIRCQREEGPDITP